MHSYSHHLYRVAAVCILSVALIAIVPKDWGNTNMLAGIVGLTAIACLVAANIFFILKLLRGACWPLEAGGAFLILMTRDAAEPLTDEEERLLIITALGSVSGLLVAVGIVFAFMHGYWWIFVGGLVGYVLADLACEKLCHVYGLQDPHRTPSISPARSA